MKVNVVTGSDSRVYIHPSVGCLATHPKYPNTAIITTTTIMSVMIILYLTHTF